MFDMMHMLNYNINKYVQSCIGRLHMTIEGLVSQYAQANAEHARIRVTDIDETAVYKDEEGCLWHGGVLKHHGILPEFGQSDAASMIVHLTRC